MKWYSSWQLHLVNDVPSSLSKCWQDTFLTKISCQRKNPGAYPGFEVGSADLIALKIFTIYAHARVARVLGDTIISWLLHTCMYRFTCKLAWKEITGMYMYLSLDWGKKEGCDFTSTWDRTVLANGLSRMGSLREELGCALRHFVQDLGGRITQATPPPQIVWGPWVS